MKRTLFIVIFLSFLKVSQSQVAGGFKYQAVARDEKGAVLAEKNINIRISILEGGEDNAAIYSEIHHSRTNEFGLFTLTIGSGSNPSSSFRSIPWSTGNKWLQVEIDPSGGSNFIAIGTSEILSVPYALYAENAGSLSSIETDTTIIAERLSLNSTVSAVRKPYSGLTIPRLRDFQLDSIQNPAHGALVFDLDVGLNFGNGPSGGFVWWNDSDRVWMQIFSVPKDATPFYIQSIQDNWDHSFKGFGCDNISPATDLTYPTLKGQLNQLLAICSTFSDTIITIARFAFMTSHRGSIAVDEKKLNSDLEMYSWQQWLAMKDSFGYVCGHYVFYATSIFAEYGFQAFNATLGTNSNHNEFIQGEEQDIGHVIALIERPLGTDTLYYPMDIMYNRYWLNSNDSTLLDFAEYCRLLYEGKGDSIITMDAGDLTIIMDNLVCMNDKLLIPDPYYYASVEASSVQRIERSSSNITTPYRLFATQDIDGWLSKGGNNVFKQIAQSFPDLPQYQSPSDGSILALYIIDVFGGMGTSRTSKVLNRTWAIRNLYWQ